MSALTPTRHSTSAPNAPLNRAPESNHASAKKILKVCMLALLTSMSPASAHRPISRVVRDEDTSLRGDNPYSLNLRMFNRPPRENPFLLDPCEDYCNEDNILGNPLTGLPHLLSSFQSNDLPLPGLCESSSKPYRSSDPNLKGIAFRNTTTHCTTEDGEHRITQVIAQEDLHSCRTFGPVFFRFIADIMFRLPSKFQPMPHAPCAMCARSYQSSDPHLRAIAFRNITIYCITEDGESTTQLIAQKDLHLCRRQTQAIFLQTLMLFTIVAMGIMAVTTCSPLQDLNRNF